MVEKPYKTMRHFSEAEQKSLVVEHITAIDRKPLRKFAQEQRIIERSYRKIQRRQLCKMLYDLICAEVITDLTLIDKRGELNLVATKSIREAKVLEFDLWYKRIPGGRRAQPSFDVVIDEEVCLALDSDLFHLLEILGQSRLIIRVTKADLTDGTKKFFSLMFGEWYEEMSKERTVSYLLSSGLKLIAKDKLKSKQGQSQMNKPKSK